MRKIASKGAATREVRHYKSLLARTLAAIRDRPYKSAPRRPFGQRGLFLRFSLKFIAITFKFGVGSAIPHQTIA
jgi:hypothetical protein